MSAQLEVAGISSRGLVRPVNEDGASIDGHRLAEAKPFQRTLPAGRHALIVADGMGGHARGDLARDLVLEILEARADELHSDASCIEALRAANRAVYDHALDHPGLRAMGSTVVGTAINGSACRWFNVGDSRAYHFDGHLRQISQDHVPPALNGRRTHAVTQSLGGLPRFMEVTPSVGHLELGVGDRILLCSDGLTDVVADDEIATLLSEAPAAAHAVERILAACLSRGAPDNVTVLVARLG